MSRCPSKNSTASALRSLRKCTGLELKRGAISKRRAYPSFSATSANRGPFFYWIARGIDERPVGANRIRKSVGVENTSAADSRQTLVTLRECGHARAHTVAAVAWGGLKGKISADGRVIQWRGGTIWLRSAAPVRQVPKRWRGAGRHTCMGSRQARRRAASLAWRPLETALGRVFNAAIHE